MTQLPMTHKGIKYSLTRSETTAACRLQPCRPLGDLLATQAFTLKHRPSERVAINLHNLR